MSHVETDHTTTTIASIFI